LPGLVRLDFTGPPVFFPFGHKPSQLAKCFTVGHFVKSVPNPTDQGQRMNLVDAFDLCQVNPRHRVQPFAHLELRVVRLTAAHSRFRR
jgi:hypothetical protein